MNANHGAYGAYRVMVCAGQTGEAAGEAAAMSFTRGLYPHEIGTEALRKRLADGGSIIL